MNYLDQAGTFGTPTRLGHEPADPGDLLHWRHLSEVETTTMLDVVIPVHNEEIDLAPAVSRLHRYLQEQLPYSFRITIADNASTDAPRRSPISWPTRSRRSGPCIWTPRGGAAH